MRRIKQIATVLVFVGFFLLFLAASTDDVSNMQREFTDGRIFKLAIYGFSVMLTGGIMHLIIEKVEIYREDNSHGKFQ